MEFSISFKYTVLIALEEYSFRSLIYMGFIARMAAARMPLIRLLCEIVSSELQSSMQEDIFLLDGCASPCKQLQFVGKKNYSTARVTCNLVRLGRGIGIHD